MLPGQHLRTNTVNERLDPRVRKASIALEERGNFGRTLQHRLDPWEAVVRLWQFGLHTQRAHDGWPVGSIDAIDQNDIVVVELHTPPLNLCDACL